MALRQQLGVLKRKNPCPRLREGRSNSVEVDFPRAVKRTFLRIHKRRNE